MSKAKMCYSTDRVCMVKAAAVLKTQFPKYKSSATDNNKAAMY